MKAHVRKFHSEAAKWKAEESIELDRLELLNANKVPRLSVESQKGGAVTSSKRTLDERKKGKKERRGTTRRMKLTDLMSMVAVGIHCFKQTLTEWVDPKIGKKGKSLIRSLPLAWSSFVKQNQMRV